MSAYNIANNSNNNNEFSHANLFSKENNRGNIYLENRDKSHNGDDDLNKDIDNTETKEMINQAAMLFLCSSAKFLHCGGIIKSSSTDDSDKVDKSRNNKYISHNDNSANVNCTDNRRMLLFLTKVLVLMQVV